MLECPLFGQNVLDQIVYKIRERSPFASTQSLLLGIHILRLWFRKNIYTKLAYHKWTMCYLEFKLNVKNIFIETVLGKKYNIF